MAAACINDVTARETMWRRYGGDDWAAFDALPPGVRRRMHEHAYDAWAVNALMLWKSFRRKRACSIRGERALLNYLDRYEAMELAGYDAVHFKTYGSHLPHVAAGATVLRYAGVGAAS